MNSRSINILSSCAQLLIVFNGVSATENMNASSTRFTSPTFTMPLYRASINYNNSLLYLDGPILVDNFTENMYFVINSENFVDFDIHLIDTEDPSRKKLELEPLNSTPMSKDFDVVVIEGMDKNLEPVCRSSILLLSTKNNLDLYRMTFTIAGQEYIILNFFYFKWFLGLLTITGLLILIIELHEVMLNLRKRRLGTVKYQELETTPSLTGSLPI